MSRWLKLMAGKPEVQEEYLESLSPRTNAGWPDVLGDDSGDIIARIQVHLEELGWTKDQAIAHMRNRHGWRTVGFRQLSDADLDDLLSELKQLQFERYRS